MENKYEFFIAGRARNKENILRICDMFDKYNVSYYCFLKYEDEWGYGNSSQTPEEKQKEFESLKLKSDVVLNLFNSDLNGEKSSKNFLLVLPAGKAAHIEAGIAYGLGKKCYAIGEYEQTDTLYNIFEEIFEDEKELEKFLEKYKYDLLLNEQTNVNEDLKKYIDEYIFPEYKKNEDAHGLEHIMYVIRRSNEIVKNNKLEVDNNIVYTVAAYHDIAHHIDRENHEKVSAEIMYNDESLKRFFSDDERIIIKEAIEDHRASSNHEPRSIYGKIVSTADRNNSVELCLKRTYLYGKNKEPNASDEELFKRAYVVLNEKFGENGYAKFFFKDEEYEHFLTEIRELLKDENVFCKTQKEYIRKLKNQKIIK